MVHYSKSSHVGSCLSIVDILYVLYFEIMNVDTHNPQKSDRDKCILSKGHGSAALYATLAEKGFFPKNYLNEFYIDNGKLPGHIDITSVPGLDASAGSLGHGLSLGIGMSIANQRDHNPGNIYIILGDGECNEGSIWEGVMFAAQLRLTNLTVIIDKNELQGFGRTKEVINQDNMAERWKCFGWESYQVNGHNPNELIKIFKKPQNGPKVIVANTIKGKGISFMEDKLEWHYKSPNEEEYQTALQEIGEKI